MPTLEAIVVEDVPHARKDLTHLVEDYCPEVTITGFADYVSEVRTLLQSKKPNLVFLDLSLQGIHAWDVLSSEDLAGTQVIIVTGDATITKAAVRPETIAYLTKPVDPAELMRAVQQALSTMSSSTAGQGPERLRVSNRQGVHLIPLPRVIKLTADNNRTQVHVQDSPSPIQTSKTLKTFAYLDEHPSFCRIHHSHLINLEHVQRYHQVDGGMVTLSDGSTLSISKSYMPNFIRKIEQHVWSS